MRRRVEVENQWNAWTSMRGCGRYDVESALEGVEEMLPNMAMDAQIGRVVVEMRRFVRLAGEEVDRVRRRMSACGLLGAGSLVGSLAAWRLLHRESKLVVSDFLRSCLKMSSMSSTLGG